MREVARETADATRGTRAPEAATVAANQAGVVGTLVRYGYVPLLLVGANGASILLATSGAPHAAHLVVVSVAVVVSFVAERVLPYSAAWNADHGDSARDVAHAVVNETLAFVSIALIPVLAAVSPSLALWPHDWPFVPQLLVAIVVADFGITLAHMASHRFEPLWRLHAVHHSIERMYGFNGLMKHPLHQAIETTAGVTPLLLAGMPVDVATCLAVAVAVQLLLQHSNVDYRVGPLRGVLALNEGHRFHHLRWPVVGDVNFGLFTLVWDRLLGTWSFDPARRFTSADLGIEKWPSYPRAYGEQLLQPFRRVK
jgi:sterol desaturase/sphingolipid hydroxylase (fatty acid hydroxylase superfamily)